MSAKPTSLSSVLEETRVFEPSPEFAAKARIGTLELARLTAEAADDYTGFWGRLAKENLAWQTPFRTVLDDRDAPNYRWFTDGKTNASVNCLDRHLGARGDKIAIRFESDAGAVRTLSYKQLHAAVCQLANGLRSLGVAKGDRVVVYLPHTPEAVTALLACARIGATHSVVFGGFSAASLRDRIEDAGAKWLITADGNSRGGNLIDLKKTIDEALSLGGSAARGGRRTQGQGLEGA